MHIVVADILKRFPSGYSIPKPKAKAPFITVGIGMRRGEATIIYRIPNHRSTAKLLKGVNESELNNAHAELERTGTLTRKWFNSELPGCAREGACNFTTIGGLFVALGIAKYDRAGIYRKA